MCCGSGRSEKSSGPKWLQDAAKGVVKDAQEFYDKPYQSYSGPRQADFSGDQQAAFQGLRDFVGSGGTSALANEGTGFIRDAAGAPGSQVSTERVVDENGRLGAFNDYFNSYVSNALQPALREIDEGAAQERKRIGAMANSSGAFGDARHGILESELAGQTQTARGDVAARGFADAFNTAMGLRSSDLDRFFNQDVSNANLNETALNRMMTGGGALTSEASAQQNDLLSRLSALLQSGTSQQQQAQTALDIPYQEFEKGKQDEYDKLAALVSVLGQVPYERKTTTDDGGAGFMAGLGSLLGAI